MTAGSGWSSLLIANLLSLPLFKSLSIGAPMALSLDRISYFALSSSRFQIMTPVDLPSCRWFILFSDGGDALQLEPDARSSIAALTTHICSSMFQSASGPQIWRLPVLLRRRRWRFIISFMGISQILRSGGPEAASSPIESMDLSLNLIFLHSSPHNRFWYPNKVQVMGILAYFSYNPANSNCGSALSLNRSFDWNFPLTDSAP